MTQLLIIREYIKNLIGRFENYVKPVSKFLFCFITLTLINKNIGFTGKLDSIAIVAIVSLAASFLPLNFIIVVAAGFILLHLYTLSLAAVIVAGILFLLIFLLYFRFSPKDTILLLVTPLAFILKIPYAIPLAAGLVSTPAAVVSVGSGVVIYYMLHFMADNQTALVVEDTSQILEKFKFILDNLLLNNKQMVVLAFAFAVTIIVVSIIRKLPVDHAWTIAIVTGTLANIVIVLAGDLKYGTYIPKVSLFLGSIVGVLITVVIKFFLFNVDYSRTERVTFEDDEYVYYVKAVPKNNVDISFDEEDDEEEEEEKPKAKKKRNLPERVEIPDDVEDDMIAYNVKRRNMSDIERAAQDKARKSRISSNRKQ